MEKEKRMLDPKDLTDALAILEQAIGELRGVAIRTVWKALETVEKKCNEPEKIEKL